jgi:hypothetical protein
MALMLGKLYDALRSANVPEDKAREAAEEVATYEQVRSDARLLKWTMGVMFALILGVFWMQWQMLGQLAQTNSRLTTVEQRLGTLEAEIAEVRQLLSAVEEHLGALATVPTPQ